MAILSTGTKSKAEAIGGSAGTAIGDAVQKNERLAVANPEQPNELQGLSSAKVGSRNDLRAAVSDDSSPYVYRGPNQAAKDLLGLIQSGASPELIAAYNDYKQHSFGKVMKPIAA